MPTVTDLPEISPARAWRAVMDRDRRADGTFVFAVRSTGIFCRPSCPARRPLRSNVSFYAAPPEAREAGFRPCLRCKPETLSAERAEERALLSRACHQLAVGETPVALPALAAQLHTTQGVLRQLFQKYLGVSPAAWARASRLVRFKRALRHGRGVTSAQYEAGFGSSSRVYESSDNRLGMTPAIYGRGGKGMQIRFALFEVSSGKALVAWTERGICAAFLGQSVSRLIADLTEEFPAAERRAATRAEQEWATTIVRAAMEGIGSSDLPLDITGTAFQWRVWQALRKIPRGQVRTYTQVARSIGQPSAVRAVARACATNKAAILIPCHRVIRESGDLAGYRWGIERKAGLLASEK